MIGNIPEKLVYILRPACKADWEWDDFNRSIVYSGENVIPVFVADPTRPKTVETGVSWASDWSDLSKKPKQVTADNTPLKLRILSLEHRTQGGRAYKVVFGPENYYADLREDVLLDTILEVGISKGGIPNAEFIWAKVGSQMKLVRIGSELHRELTKTTVDSKKTKISKFDIGGVYRNKKGDFSIYLGPHWIFQYDNVQESRGIYGMKHTVGFQNFRWVPRQLWFEIASWELSKKDIFSMKDVAWDRSYAYKWVKNASFIEKVHQMDIPSDWKEKLTWGIKKNLKENSMVEKIPSIYSLTNLFYYITYLSFVSTSETPVLNNETFLDPIKKYFEIEEIRIEK